ncbi:MAG: D-TA family PLP-dependent enzyme [Pirellulales bacterium]
MSAPWYQIANADEIDSPALLVFRDRVAENVRRMIAYAGGVQNLRPHVKTHKTAEIIRMQMAAGIHQFKVATLAEAEMVARCDAPDCMLAYQPLGPKATRFAQLVRAFPATRFSAIADDAEAIRGLSVALIAAGATVDIWLDIDVGMGRTGIQPGPAAVALYRLLDDLPGVKPVGLHVYDGHVRQKEIEERRRACDEAFAPAEQMREELVRLGFPRPRVVAGGTPTFPIHARHADRQCSPGTCTYWDISYETKFPDLQFLHAAVLLSRVISKPGPGRLCMDLGYKAVSPDNPDPRAVWLDLPDAKMVNHSEEHIAVETSLADRHSVGDILYAIPFHVCPTVALHREVIVVEQGQATARWTVTARDRRITI